MTPQEAIDFIDNEVQIDVRYCSIQQIDKTREVFAFAKEALKKQIPKKPAEYKEFEDGAFYNIDFMCSACNNAVIGQPYKPGYCKHCGQALDWSDTE